MKRDMISLSVIRISKNTTFNLITTRSVMITKIQLGFSFTDIFQLKWQGTVLHAVKDELRYVPRYAKKFVFYFILAGNQFGFFPKSLFAYLPAWLLIPNGGFTTPTFQRYWIFTLCIIMLSEIFLSGAAPLCLWFSNVQRFQLYVCKILQHVNKDSIESVVKCTTISSKSWYRM